MKKIVSILLAVIVYASSWAQQTITVTGTVVHAGDNEPLSEQSLCPPQEEREPPLT